MHARSVASRFVTWVLHSWGHRWNERNARMQVACAMIVQARPKNGRCAFHVIAGATALAPELPFTSSQAPSSCLIPSLVVPDERATGIKLVLAGNSWTHVRDAFTAHRADLRPSDMAPVWVRLVRRSWLHIYWCRIPFESAMKALGLAPQQSRQLVCQ